MKKLKIRCRRKNWGNKAETRKDVKNKIYFPNTCTHVSLLGRLWRPSDQSVRQSQFPGGGGELGGRLCAQEQTWHLHNSHQIPWLDQRKDRSVDAFKMAKQGHIDMNTDWWQGAQCGSLLHHSGVVALTPCSSCSGKSLKSKLQHHFMSTVILWGWGWWNVLKCKYRFYFCVLFMLWF